MVEIWRTALLEIEIIPRFYAVRNFQRVNSVRSRNWLDPIFIMSASPSTRGSRSFAGHRATFLPSINHPRTCKTGFARSSPLRNSDGSDTVYGFQINERYLQWDDSATRQLLRIHVAEQLDTDVDHVNQKIAELSVLLPDLVNKLETMKASLLLSLIHDTDKVAQRMLDLKEVLLDMNVSMMVAGNVWLLKEPSKEVLQKNYQILRYGYRDSGHRGTAMHSM